VCTGYSDFAGPNETETAGHEPEKERVWRTGRLDARIGNGLVSAGFVGEDSPRVKATRALARLTAGIYSVPAGFPAGFSWNLQENPQVVQSRADGRTDLMKSGAP
jgi:hypothetical protein